VHERAFPLVPLLEVVGHVADGRPARPAIGVGLERPLEKAPGLLDPCIVDRAEHGIEMLLATGCDDTVSAFTSGLGVK
jgi:hypothetical protein